MSSLDRACDTLDLVTAPVDATGLAELAIFGEDFVDGRAPTRGVVFTEHVVKITVSKVDIVLDTAYLLSASNALAYLDQERLYCRWRESACLTASGISFK